MEDFAQYITPTLILPVLAMMAVLLFISAYWSAVRPRPGTLDWIAAHENPAKLSFSAPIHPMTRRDALPLLLLTAVYAVTAFWNLGSFADPQTFQSFSSGTAVTFTLDREITLDRVEYYTGLSTGSYTLEYSADGQTWGRIDLDQPYDDLFKWLWAEPADGPVQVRMFRLTAANDKMELGELAFYGPSASGGDALLSVSVRGADLLFDEQELVPAESTYLNSSYFDEVYHARTAYEHIRGIYPYEITHPPLGKLLIGLGIRAFGMTPFGWRFIGTSFGVLMLPLLYVFLKNLFGRTNLAVCGTALFATDFLHLTQTRIATIDTYAVFFILAMYFFLYRWLAQPPDASFRQGALPLFLSGLFFGIGAACKWTVFYGAAGLAVLYLIKLVLTWRARRAMENPPPFAPWAAATLLFSVLVFVLIPAVIYCLAYLPYAEARGDTSLHSLLAIVLENQRYMFQYHQGVTVQHPYAARWWQWLFDIRPILYYRSEPVSGLRSAFGAFNNPLISWAGLLSVVTVGVQAVRRRSGKALFLVIGYLAEMLPWLLIARPTFAYHYFPSLIFLVLSICYLMNDMMERPDFRWRRPVYGFTGLSAALYVMFYPVLTGVTVPTWYTTWFLRWLPSWPF